MQQLQQVIKMTEGLQRDLIDDDAFVICVKPIDLLGKGNGERWSQYDVRWRHMFRYTYS